MGVIDFSRSQNSSGVASQSQVCMYKCVLDDRKIFNFKKGNRIRSEKYANKLEIKKYGNKLKMKLSDHRTKG